MRGGRLARPKATISNDAESCRSTVNSITLSSELWNDAIRMPFSVGRSRSGLAGSKRDASKGTHHSSFTIHNFLKDAGHTMPENVEIAVLRAHFEELLVRPIPLIKHFLNTVIVPIKLKRNGPLVRLSPGITLNCDLQFVSSPFRAQSPSQPAIESGGADRRELGLPLQRCFREG